MDLIGKSFRHWRVFSQLREQRFRAVEHDALTEVLPVGIMAHHTTELCVVNEPPAVEA